MARRKLEGTMDKAAGAPAPRPAAATPAARGDAALVRYSFLTTRARVRALKRYALDNDVKIYEAMESALTWLLDGNTRK